MKIRYLVEKDGWWVFAKKKRIGRETLGIEKNRRLVGPFWNDR